MKALFDDRKLVGVQAGRGRTQSELLPAPRQAFPEDAIPVRVPETPSRLTCVESILVPTDFSPWADRALAFALGLGNQWKATLTVLHVIDVNCQAAPGELGNAEQLMERIWANAIAQMERVRHRLSSLPGSQTLLLEGLPWEQTVELSQNVDLCVLGQKPAKPGFKPFSKGTVQRILQNARCPLLLVRE